MNANVQNQFNLDANEQAFLQKELEAVEAETYDVQYPEYPARRLIPVSFEINSGATTYKYKQYDRVGLAKVVSSYANDFPRVDIKAKEFIGEIRSMGDSYGYNIQEIRGASFAKIPLERMKAMAAKASMTSLENNIAFFGDSANNLQGFLSNPNIPDGAAVNGAWIATNAPDQVLADISEAIQTMADVTKKIERADTLLISTAEYTWLATTPRSIHDPQTLLTWLENNLGKLGITMIDGINELKGTGTGNTNQFVLYRRDPMKLKLQVPQDFEQFPAQVKGLDYEIPCHQRCGGVQITYPLSIIKRYGI